MTLHEALKPIPGDPGRIRASGEKLHQLGADCGKAADDLQKQGGKAMEGWTGPRAAMYGVSVGGTALAFDVTEQRFQAAGAALKKFANALETAQERVKYYADKYRANEQKLAKPGISPQEFSEVKREQELLPGFAGTSADTMSQAGAAAVQKLQELAGFRPAKAKPSPKELLDHIKAGGGVYMDFKNISDPALAALALLDAGPYKGYRVLQAIRAGRLATEAREVLGRSQDIKDLITRIYLQGDTGMSRAEIGAWSERTAQRLNVATRNLAEAEEALAKANQAKGIPLGGLKFARAAGALGLLAGAVDVWKPSHTGWRGHGDRFFGAAGGVAGFMVLVGATGGTAGVVAAVLGASAAAWTFGNWAYDKRNRFDDWAKGAGRWLKDRPKRFGEGLRDLANPRRFAQ